MLMKLEEMQLKDTLRMFNGLVERCFSCLLYTSDAADAAGGGSELSVQVHLCEGHGAAAASFWAWAERLRNDVIRDTRKWRRLAAREAKPKPNE